jgi:glycosyltransferase involved in cell wall biosynthesis
MAGGSFAPFTEQVRRLGLENHLIVRENVNAIEDYLQAADLGVFASETESFCLSILEAMCFGCPSVATRVGGIPELVQDGTTGMLCPPGDAHALTASLLRLIEDRSLRLKMGAAARVRAKEFFSPEVIVPKYEAVYYRVCSLG